MAARDMPRAEVPINEDLVRRLLAEQHPDLAALPLGPVVEGWDNATYRLGDDLAARLPRRAIAAPLVAHEQAWLPSLAAHLPLPVPAPVRAGRPGCGYPWSWSVVPWFVGEVAAITPPADLVATAERLGGFVAALHRPAPADAPANPYRGVPLGERDAAVQARIDQLGDLVDGAAAREVWAGAMAVPPWAGPPVWLHGDLHPANLIVGRGEIVAVVDFGDLTAGDPATDLAVAWMLLPAQTHATLRRATGGVDDGTWARARGWALSHALACLANSADNSVMEAMGRRTLDAVLADRG